MVKNDHTKEPLPYCDCRMCEQYPGDLPNHIQPKTGYVSVNGSTPMDWGWIEIAPGQLVREEDLEKRTEPW